MELRGLSRNFAEMEGGSDDEDRLGPCPPPPAKRQKAGNFPWTDNLNLTFVNVCFRRKVHVKTTDMSQETKFELVASDLLKMEQTAFYCSPFITGTNLKSKWNRMAKEYATKAALEREGANLSGLPSEVEKPIATMLKVKFDQKADREALTKKEKERDAKMLTHERAILTRNTDSTPAKVLSFSS